MNKLLILCGLAVLSTTFTPEKSKTPSECEPLTLKANFQNVNPVILAMDQEDIWDAPQWTDPSKTADKTEIDLKNIPFLEEEDELDLGFDTALYLPEGFDPHNSYFDLDAVVYIEDEKDDVLELDTANYLPEGFNPYAAPSDFMSISFIEDEAEVDLGFDTSRYLPAGFDPYETKLDLDSIVYIEEEEEVVLGFDTADYLPRGFNPWSR